MNLSLLFKHNTPEQSLIKSLDTEYFSNLFRYALENNSLYRQSLTGISIIPIPHKFNDSFFNQ
jgi:hypothetical protein